MLKNFEGLQQAACQCVLLKWLMYRLKKKSIVPSSVLIRLFQQCVLRLFGFIHSCFTSRSDCDQDPWSRGKEELNTPPPSAFLQFFDSFIPWNRGQVMLLPHGAGSITPASCGGSPCAREALEGKRLRFPFVAQLELHKARAWAREITLQH